MYPRIRNAAIVSITLLAGTAHLLQGAPACRLFLSAPIYSFGQFPNSLAEGDFNGDGILDLVVADRSGYVYVLLGRSNGTFAPPLALPAGTLPYWAAVGDFNNDGKLDLAVANSTFGQGAISIFLGNGRQFRKNPGALGTVRYEFGDNSVTVISEAGRSELQWQAFLKRKETPGFLCLHLSPITAYVIPLAQIPSAQAGQLRELLRSRVPAAAGIHSADIPVA